MIKNFKNIIIIALIYLCVSSMPSIAVDHNGSACEVDSSKCYDSDVDLDLAVITIYLNDKDSKVLTLEQDDDGNIYAYDPNSQKTYSVEVY